MSDADASTDAEGQPTARLETPVSVRALLLLAVAALAVGTFVSWLGEATLPSLAVMLAAPGLWALLVLACALAWARRRPLRAMRLAVVGACALAPLHVGLLAPPWEIPPAPHTYLDDCPSSRATAPPDRLVIVTWNTQRTDASEAPALAERLDGVDLVLLQEVDGAFADALADALDGEAVHVGQNWRPGSGQPAGYAPSMGPALVVPRGRFARCGEQFAQMFTLPGLDERTTRSILARVEGGPTVVVVHHDRPRQLGEIPAWPEQLRQVSRRVASLARAAGDDVIVAGDTNTTARFHRFHATLRAAGLRSVAVRRTWPAEAFGRDVVPVYALDRVYLGPAWRAVAVAPLRFGASDHRGLRVELVRVRP